MGLADCPAIARVGQAPWTKRGAFSRKLRGEVGVTGAWTTVRAVKDSERDAAVEAHLGALDEEIARLRKMEAALDRRIEQADDERRAVEEKTRRRGEPGEDQGGQ